MKLQAVFAILLIGSGASAQVSFTVSSFTPDIYGLGTAKLTWSAPSATTIQIRVNSATGPVLVQAGKTGSVLTGEWVTDGMLFYLQDVTVGPPGVTLAAITAHAYPAATLVGTPNPYKPDSAGLGLIGLSWSVGPDVAAMEIRIDSATGPSLTGVTNAISANTGEWVSDGMQFFLQNVTNGEPGYTLAVLTAREASLISGPYLVSVGHRLSYSAPGATAVEIHVDKPWGTLLGRFSGPTGTVNTAEWEPDGMRFFLQDVSNGKPLTDQYTLAAVVASYPDYSPPLPSAVLFGATPGVVADPGNTGLGMATLFWSAPGYSNLEVHVNAPNGPLFSGSSGSVGTAVTGPWVNDGMRFYLQDPSSGTTIGIARVDLQPATQHYVAFYTSEANLLIFSRESGDRIGWFPGSVFPPGVTPIDLDTSPDGKLIYAMGSDFNYYTLDPATATVVARFSVGSQPTAPSGSSAFTLMKGPAGQDLLIASPDPQGNISIVDPNLQTVISSVNCQCSGQLSPNYNQFDGTTYFYNPVIGGGNQIFGVTQSLLLATPIMWGPLISTLPMGTPNGSWSLLTVDSGLKGAFVAPNFTMTGQEQIGHCGAGCQPPPPFGIPIPDGAGIYDILSAGTGTSDSGPNPESISPDGQSVYGRVFAQNTFSSPPYGYPGGLNPPDGYCYIADFFGSPSYTCFQATGVTRSQLSSTGGAPTFALAAMLNAPAARPPSAFDDSFAYLIWLNMDNQSPAFPNGIPISLGSIRKVDPLTLQEIPGDNPIPLATPNGISPPLTGDMVGNILVGAYTYNGSPNLTTPPFPALVLIEVTPVNPSLPLGATQQFTATGTFTDGSTQNLTSTVTWSASPTSVATIISATGSQGLATGVGQGTATVTATWGAVNGSTNLTVTAPVSASIVVTPVNSSIRLGLGAMIAVAPETSIVARGTTESFIPPGRSR